MGDILEIERSLQQRVDHLRAGADELARIEAALSALRGRAPRQTAGTIADHLMAVIAAEPGLKAAEIARRTDCAPQSVHRRLAALLQDGRLRRDESKRWHLPTTA